MTAVKAEQWRIIRLIKVTTSQWRVLLYRLVLYICLFFVQRYFAACLGSTSFFQHHSGEEMSLGCECEGVMQHAGLRGTSPHLCAAPFLPDKMHMRLETCIICNRYRPLMVSLLPLAAHNGPFLRFSASCLAFWWWQNGNSECHLGRNMENDGTFHLLVKKLALHALQLMCRVLVLRVAGNNKRENCPSQEEHFILQQKQGGKMSHM